jgi:uncharacterized surface protein with fasciclin (FAS1) repeats
MPSVTSRFAGAFAVLALAGSLAACSGSSSPAASAASATPAAATPGAMGAPGTADAAMTDFGSACSAVPASGAGSFNGMETAPVATAASANPVLSTLVAAVKAAGLVDTLNNAPNITVFAPANAAFAKIPAATLNGVLADKAELTKILEYHVVAGRLTPAELAGSHTTLEGGTITVAGSGTDYTVTGGSAGNTANVICGNVQTANATVYIIDSVLMPSS